MGLDLAFCDLVDRQRHGLLLYERKRHAQWLSHIDQVTKLKMESIRNRVSPHFIFNILNREISSEEEGSSRRTQLSGLVELLRSSLEITEKLSITLEENYALSGLT